MRSLEQAIRYVIPVNSFSKAVVDVEPKREDPSVGLCWGGPSDFSNDTQSVQSEEELSWYAEFADEHCYYSGDEVWRDTEKVRIVNTEEGSSEYIDTESIKSVTFYMGQTQEESEVRLWDGAIQPIITIVENYLKIMLPGNVSVVGQSERGENAPPDTPPEPTPSTWGNPPSAEQEQNNPLVVEIDYDPNYVQTKTEPTYKPPADEPEVEEPPVPQKPSEPPEWSDPAVTLSPFRNVIEPHFGTKVRFWRVDYSYHEGETYGEMFFYEVGRELDKSDPKYKPIKYLEDWDVSFREAAIAWRGFWAEGEKEKIVTTKTSVSGRYDQDPIVGFWEKPSGQYTYLDWRFEAFKDAFPGWKQDRYVTFFTKNKEEEEALPARIAEWWKAFHVQADKWSWTRREKGDHYETDAEGNPLPPE